MPNPVFEIQGLRVSFRNGGQREEVLKGIDLRVFQGETLGIVGESGSGKSLSALAIGGLLPPAAGVSCDGFRWFEKDKVALDLHDLRQEKFAGLRGKEIAYIFQDPGACLNPVLTCGEQVAEAIRRHQCLGKRVARQEAIDWLERVNLPDPARIYRAFPHELSGGQKQRVMIAAALCSRPRLLIADEPTTALDATVQRHILDLLKSLKQELGLSTLFISHDLDIIGEMSDRVVVVRDGEIIEENSTDALFSDPKHPYTRLLLDCRPSIRNHPARLPISSKPEGKQVAVMSSEEGAPSPPSAGIPIIRVQGLQAGFRLRPSSFMEKAGWLQALEDVGFELYPGETLGIVGESGSGKSTLARVLLGLHTPVAGKIEFGGKALPTAKVDWKNLRQALQIVFQDPFTSLNPRQRVGDAVLEPLLVHTLNPDLKACKDRVVRILNMVGLSEKFLGRFPNELSGGQRQRVNIARALVLNPRVLICDEAVSALDVSVQALVLNLLKDLQQEMGLSYLFISHDLAAVAFMSDRIMVMNKGRIVETGNTGELLSSPKHPYTRDLLSAIPGKRDRATG